jgi:hypothetical protein
MSKNEKKGLKQKIADAAKTTEHVGKIAVWSITIILILASIPTIYIMGKLAAQLQEATSSMNTEKSFNMIGTLIDEDAAKVLANTFEKVAYAEGCDEDQIMFDINYTGINDIFEIENEKTNQTISKILGDAIINQVNGLIRSNVLISSSRNFELYVLRFQIGRGGHGSPIKTGIYDSITTICGKSRAT